LYSNCFLSFLFLDVSVNCVAVIISGGTIANNGSSGIEGVAVGLGLGEVEELLSYLE